MRRALQWTGTGLIVLFVCMQFFGAERTNPPVTSDVDAPEDVKAILRRSCFDCHSHETRWPWYGRIAPMSWFVVDHVDHGRKDLNFSEWPNFDFEAQDIEFLDIAEQVENGEMPLASYLLLHPGARLSDDDRRRLLEWAGAAD